MTINEEEIIFKGIMHKINRKNNKTKQRFFILTPEKFYYLKSAKTLKIRGYMDTKFVRV